MVERKVSGAFATPNSVCMEVFPIKPAPYLPSPLSTTRRKYTGRGLKCIAPPYEFYISLAIHTYFGTYLHSWEHATNLEKYFIGMPELTRETFFLPVLFVDSKKPFLKIRKEKQS